MARTFLLDSATLVEVLRSSPSPRLVARLREVPSRARWTSAVSVGQVLVAARGHANPRLMQRVVQLVAAIRVAPFDLPAAQAFAKLRASMTVASVDEVMIAAVAVVNRHTLVTRTPHAFAGVTDLEVENWVE